MPNKQAVISKNDPQQAGKQTDLAEGELKTVEESIRIHEQKGDLKSPNPEDVTVPKAGH